MVDIHPGRYTARLDGEDIAVFLIGMRINRLHKVTSWLPAFAAMPRMFKHLAENPEAGMLGSHSWLGRTTILLSYWRSAEHVNRFASDPDAPHAAVWRRFNKRVAGSGDVGIWHETYTVHAGDYETIYAGMPSFGLARATNHIPVTAGLRTAKQRRANGARPGATDPGHGLRLEPEQLPPTIS